MNENARLTPSRLALARKRRGLTLVRLSEVSGLSTRSLSSYENGRDLPSPPTVELLARALGLECDFLVGPDIEDIPVDRISFRALSKMTSSQRDMAVAVSRIAAVINDWVEERFKLPTLDVPTLPGCPPDRAASRVRNAWGLGVAPIGNLIHLLETKGARVFSLPERCYEIDAFSFYWNSRPYVLLNTTKSAERSRFDVAHELGHLVLHSEHEVPHGREAEQAANLFASSFLMPEEGLLAQRLHNANVARIVQAKQKWRVSAMALNTRLQEIGLVTEWGYRTNARDLSRRGYRRGEPESDLRHEASQLLMKVFRWFNTDDRVSLARLSKDIGVRVSELNDYMFGLVPTVLAGEGTSSHTSRPPLLEVVDNTGSGDGKKHPLPNRRFN